MGASNYQGTGIWTEPLLVSIITLPTPATNYVWSHIAFVTVGGQERLIVCGGAKSTTIASNSFFCYILPDGTVWNISLSTQNVYTQLTTPPHNALYGKITTSYYNYINNYIYFCVSGGNNGTYNLYLNINTGVFSYYGYGSSANGLLSYASYKNIHINPVKSRLITPYTEIESHSISPASYFLRGITGNSGKYLIFDRNTGYTYINAYSDLGRFYMHDSNGNVVALFGNTDKGQAYPFGYLLRHSIYRTLMCVPSGYNSASYNYVFFQDMVSNNRIFYALASMPSGHSAFLNCDGSIGYGLFFAVSNSPSVFRLFIFEPNYSGGTATERFFDLPYQPIDMTHNQLIC